MTTRKPDLYTVDDLRRANYGEPLVATGFTTVNPSLNLTFKQARILAKTERGYTVRKARDGSDRWCVWDRKSDHHVEFCDRSLQATILLAGK